MDESDSHSRKYDEPRISKRHGIRLIEVINVKMDTIQFGLIVNLIQMKSMKVIDTIENMMKQGFQYHEELRYETSEKSYESICDQPNFGAVARAAARWQGETAHCGCGYRPVNGGSAISERRSSRGEEFRACLGGLGPGIRASLRAASGRSPVRVPFLDWLAGSGFLTADCAWHFLPPGG
jgi:hypothetical protein